MRQPVYYNRARELQVTKPVWKLIDKCTKIDTADIELEGLSTLNMAHSSTAMLSNDETNADAPHAIRLLEIVSDLVSGTNRQY
jgi:hypothetical protein